MATHNTSNFTAAEKATLETLEKAAQNIANTGAESFFAMSARNAAAAEALRAHLNLVGQRLAARLNADGTPMANPPVFIPPWGQDY
jgi:hypothetical protein